MPPVTVCSFCARYPIPCKQIKKYCQEILLCLVYLHKEVVTPPGAAEAGAGGSEAGDAAGTEDPRPKPKPKVRRRPGLARAHAFGSLLVCRSCIPCTCRSCTETSSAKTYSFR